MVSSFFFLYELFLHLQRYQFIVFQEKMIQQIRHIHPSKMENFLKTIQLSGLFALPWALLFSEALSSLLVICISIPLLIFCNHVFLKYLWVYYWPYFFLFFLIFVSVL